MRIFPAYGLDNSLLTAVLLGLYVRFFFTEWLGWVFSGLVVPGYLGAIVLLRPASAAVIVVEAVLTLLLVRGLSGLLSRLKLGTPVFGRDRFMWLVVASVGVRVLVEAVLAPLLEARLRARLGWDLSDSFGLFGIGLVLVPLLANACWKPGLVRGSLQQLVCTGITYFLLRGVLATTNLSFANIALSFERIALDFAASPKAYMLLLAGALLASRANLRFGWDTSGVAIPGLLCLGWFAPIRMASTLLEALVIASAASLFVRLPRVRDWNVEGPRRVVLMFTIGYVIKFITVAVFGAAWPSFTATDLFGFGYLLPSLLAVKIWQKRNPALVLLPTLSLSLAGVLVGSMAGYGLMLADTALKTQLAKVTVDGPDVRCDADVPLLSEVRMSRARMARTAPGPDAPPVRSWELSSLDGMLRRLRGLTAQGVTSCSHLAAQVRPGTLGLRMQAASSPSGRLYFTLREATDEPDKLRGFGLVAVAAHPTGGPVLVVEQPQRDFSELLAVVALADSVAADALVLGGLPPGLGRGEVARDRDVPLRVAVDALGGAALTVRTGKGERPHLSALVPAATVRALEAELGPISRGGLGRTTAELVLPRPSELTLAGALVPKVPHFASSALWLASLQELPPGPAVARSLVAERLLAEEVVRPLARARLPLDLEELARAVASAASELGFSVSLIDGPSPRVALHGHGEGLLFAPGAGGGGLVQAASRRLGVAELSLAVFEHHGAHALLLPTPAPGVEDTGPLARVAAPILALTPPLPDVVLVQSGGPDGPGCAVISDVLGSPAASPLARRLVSSLEHMGVGCELHTQFDVVTIDPPRPGIDLLRIRTGGDFVTLHVGPALRERFRPGTLSPAQQLLFARLEVKVERAALAHVLQAACSEPDTRLAADLPDDLVSDARAFATTRHPALIERLRTRAQESRLELMVVDDELFAEAYLVVRRRHGAVAFTLRQQVTGAVTLRCHSDVADGTRRAQGSGSVRIEVGGP
ncbi:MAG: poly-gamma-glutamate biosynthesis protein PgsC/CapC [Polyangia bacterium]